MTVVTTADTSQLYALAARHGLKLHGPLTVNELGLDYRIVIATVFPQPAVRCGTDGLRAGVVNPWTAPARCHYWPTARASCVGSSSTLVAVDNLPALSALARRTTIKQPLPQRRRS